MTDRPRSRRNDGKNRNESESENASGSESESENASASGNANANANGSENVRSVRKKRPVCPRPKHRTMLAQAAPVGKDPNRCPHSQICNRCSRPLYRFRRVPPTFSRL